MAKSGIIYGARGGNKYGPRLELHWSIVSQDIAKNTTRIKVVSVFNVTKTISYNGSSGKQGSTTAGGTTQTYTAPAPSSASQRIRTLGTTYHIITHASNGTYTGTLKGTFNLGSLYWGSAHLTSISASGDITLDPIVRGINLATVSLASGWTDTTSSKTITYTAYSTTATVKVWWRYWNAKGRGWSSWYAISTAYTSGGAITLNATYVSNMHSNNPASRTVKAEVKVAHYQGSTYLGEIVKATTFTLKPSVPAFTANVSCTGTNQALLGATSRAVQNVHTANLSITSASSTNGATVKSYSITFQGSTTNSSSTARKITRSGTVTATFKVTDSRGYVTTKTSNVYSIPYKPPTLSNIKAARYTGTTLDPVGTNYRITGKLAVSSIAPSGTNVNVPYWKVGSGTVTASANILYTGTLAIEYTKTFTITYYDKFTGSKTFKVTIPTGQATFVLGKQSAGVGVIPPANSKGLYIKDGYINGEQIGTMYPATLTSINRVVDDLNNETKHLSLYSADTLHRPTSSGDYGYVYTVCWGSSSQRMQVAYPYLPVDLERGMTPQFRNLYGGTWSEWQPMGQIAKDIASSGLNLNRIVATGTYIQRGNVHADTALNYPAAQAGILEHVEFNGFAKQTYTSYSGAAMWIRFRYSGTWRPWKSVNLT